MGDQKVETNALSFLLEKVGNLKNVYFFVAKDKK